MAAGAFFWGYFLFEVPSNIILEKVGARLWIARIMVSWGLLSGATAFCTGPWSFMTVRFLLGLAEAGLYPGIVLFLTYWFPDRHRARIMAGFTLALPVAVAAGAPMSTALLELNGLFGLGRLEVDVHRRVGADDPRRHPHLFCLTDRPAQARWLSADERAWSAREMDCERSEIEAQRQAQPDALVLGPQGAAARPQLLRHRHGEPRPAAVPAADGETGRLHPLADGVDYDDPQPCGAISMALWGWISDRMGERRWNLFWACSLAGAGLVIAGLTMGTYWALVGMSIATTGLYGTKGPFWSMPAMFLTGTAAASGIAWINSIGNLGGFFGPSAVGWARNITGSFAGGLYCLAAFALMSAVVSAFWLDIPSRTAIRAQAAAPAE